MRPTSIFLQILLFQPFHDLLDCLQVLKVFLPDSHPLHLDFINGLEVGIFQKNEIIMFIIQKRVDILHELESFSEFFLDLAEDPQSALGLTGVVSWSLIVLIIQDKVL